MFAVPRWPLALVLLTALGCAGSPPAPAVRQDALSRVAAIHGGAGPWAVAGYRMGQYALQHLGLPAGSFELEVRHHSPPQVQYACIADGAAAATGVSLGRLNLSLAEVARPDGTATVFRNRATGQSVTLRPATRFFERYLNVPREHLADAGSEVLALPEAEVFEVAASP
jgi:formylmethanofuran dehydrogenase subunit E